MGWGEMTQAQREADSPILKETPVHNPQTDPAAWWDNLVDLHPPVSPTVASEMDEVRNRFKELGHHLIDSCPPGPDLTVALRSLKDACQAAIANIACNQEHYAHD